MSSKYKVLPLDNWMKSAYSKHSLLLRNFERTLEHFEEIVPVFFRDGRYYDRYTKTYWFEVNGKAYTDNPAMFLYDLDMLSTKRLADTERIALKRLVNLATDSGITMIANRLLSADANFSHIRYLRLDAKRIRQRVLQKMTERGGDG